MISLFGTLGGLLASALLLVFGLRTGDRWVAAAAGSAVFMAAVAVIGGGCEGRSVSPAIRSPRLVRAPVLAPHNTRQQGIPALAPGPNGAGGSKAHKGGEGAGV